MKKTISFAILHFGVAFTVAYLLTGELLTASLIALIEPAVNTVAFYFHDLGWHKLKPKHSLQAKTSSFAVVHFSVAFGVAFLLSGELLTGGVMAMIEPATKNPTFRPGVSGFSVWQPFSRAKCARLPCCIAL